MTIVSHAVSHTGNVRTLNEDAFLEFPEKKVWVVADGMGGHEAGDVASRMIVDTIKSEIADLDSNELHYQHIIDAIRKANHQLYTLSHSEMDGKTIGSTVVALLLKDDSYYLLWAGDSRGYLYNDRQMKLKTKDHSQVNELIDEGIIDPSEAESHPLANVITRAVGVDDDIEIDVICGQLNPNDLFLLCSDGLNKELRDNEIEQILAHGKTSDAGLALLHSTLVRGARDNVTCLLIKNLSLSATNEIDPTDATIPICR